MQGKKAGSFEELREGKVTCYFVGSANIMELRFAGGIGAYIGSGLLLIHRTAWSKTTAAERALEIKHPPVTRRSW
jgi:hypothetical protein